MTHSMDGYDSPHGREPTDQELDAMNNERSEMAHERDADRFGPYGTHGMGPDQVVQVRIAGAGKKSYAYEVPGSVFVTVGDWVSLPGNVVNEDGGFGLVVGFGTDGYDGPLKRISEKIPEPSRWKIKMAMVKTRSQASTVYERAVADGVTQEDLLDLIKVGTMRLASKGIV